MSQRLPKSARLRKRSEFTRAQRCAIAVRNRYFVMLVYLRRDHEPARLGIVASRRVGTAVARNRGKRKIREWFRHDKGAFPAGADIVVILHRNAPDCHHQALRDELDRALTRAVRKARKAFASEGEACTSPDKAPS